MEAIGHAPSCTSVRVSTPDWHTEQRVGIQKVEERQRKIRGRRCIQTKSLLRNSTSRNQVIPGLSKQRNARYGKKTGTVQANLSKYWKSMEKLKSWLVVISASGRGSFRENWRFFFCMCSHPGPSYPSAHCHSPKTLRYPVWDDGSEHPKMQLGGVQMAPLGSMFGSRHSMEPWASPKGVI